MKIFMLLVQFILYKIKRLTISVIACADQQQTKSLQIEMEVINRNRLISTIGAFCNLHKIIIVCQSLQFIHFIIKI